MRGNFSAILFVLVCLILSGQSFGVLRREDIIDFTWRAHDLNGFRTFITFFSNGSIATGQSAALYNWTLSADTHQLSIYSNTNTLTVLFATAMYDYFWKFRLQGRNFLSATNSTFLYLTLEQVI